MPKKRYKIVREIKRGGGGEIREKQRKKGDREIERGRKLTKMTRIRFKLALTGKAIKRIPSIKTNVEITTIL